MTSSTAIVIGAGIVGSCCAWTLAHRGLKVSIVDPRGIGHGSTGAGMGHIVVMDDPAPELALTKRSRDLWDDLLPDLPEPMGYRRCGTLWIASDEVEFAEAGAKRSRLRAAGVECELLSGAQVAAAEPNLRPGLAGGLLVPGDSIVLPALVARWLLVEAGIVSARPMSARSVTSIAPHQVTLDDGSRLTADVIVNAAGLWARDLTHGLPLRARKGHLWMTRRAPNFCTHQIVALDYIKKAHSKDPVATSFNIQPRASGNLVVGSSRQFDVETPTIDAAILHDMLDRAGAMMPGLPSLKTERVWTGLRAASPDGLPIIGSHPSHPGLFLAAGHEGLGLTMSMATAELIADLATAATPTIDPTPYAPSRFKDLLA